MKRKEYIRGMEKNITIGKEVQGTETKKLIKLAIGKKEFEELKKDEELEKRVWEIMAEPEMKTTMAIAIARRELKK